MARGGTHYGAQQAHGHGLSMARPAQPLTPAEPTLIVDGRSVFLARSPVLEDARGAPYDGRQVSLSLTATDDPAGAPPIHPALAGPGVGIGGGVYTLALLPRDLWLRLAAYAHERIYVCTATPEHPPHFSPVRVVWRVAEYPTPAIEARA